MTLPVWPIGIALLALGAVLYFVAYQKHWTTWTADQRREFLYTLGMTMIVNVFFLSGLPNIESQTLQAIQQMTDPIQIRTQELLLQTSKLLSVAIAARLPYDGLRYVRNRFAPPKEPTPVFNPQELFEQQLPRLLGGIALLLILAVTGQVLENTNLLDDGLGSRSSILYLGLAISGLGLLLQLHAMAHTARQNLMLAAGSLLMTLGMGTFFCVPILMDGQMTPEYLTITTGLSVLLGAVLPLRVYWDNRRQTS